jgi:hypothetical protein
VEQGDHRGDPVGVQAVDEPPVEVQPALVGYATAGGLDARSSRIRPETHGRPGGLGPGRPFRLTAAASDDLPEVSGPGEESNLACRRGENLPRSAPPCSGSCRMSTSPGRRHRAACMPSHLPSRCRRGTGSAGCPGMAARRSHAHRQRIHVERVTLWLLGGVAELGGQPDSPRTDLPVAAVGGDDPLCREGPKPI